MTAQQTLIFVKNYCVKKDISTKYIPLDYYINLFNNNLFFLVINKRGKCVINIVKDNTLSKIYDDYHTYKYVSIYEIIKLERAETLNELLK
jgi:hypothetical protein